MIKFNTDIVLRISQKTGFKVEFTSLSESVSIDFWSYKSGKSGMEVEHLSLSTYHCKNENDRRYNAIIKHIQKGTKLPEETEFIFIND